MKRIATIVAVLALAISACNTAIMHAPRLSYTDLVNISEGYGCTDAKTCLRSAKILKMVDGEDNVEMQEIFAQFYKTVRKVVRSKNLDKIANATEYLQQYKKVNSVKKALKWGKRLRGASDSELEDLKEEALQMLSTVRTKEDYYNQKLGSSGSTELRALCQFVSDFVDLRLYLPDSVKLIE